MSESSVIRSTCEIYSVRGPKHSGWAKISLDEATGCVGIISDYGNWGYWWTNHGRESLKHFLTEVDKHYAWEKFTSRRREYNHSRTIEKMKEEIQRQLEEEIIDEDHSYNANTHLDFVEFESEDILCQAVYDSPELTSIFGDEPWELLEKDEDPQFIMFFERLWPVFIEHLKEEIENEERISGSSSI